MKGSAKGSGSVFGVVASASQEKNELKATIGEIDGKIVFSFSFIFYLLYLSPSFQHFSTMLHLFRRLPPHLLQLCRRQSPILLNPLLGRSTLFSLNLPLRLRVPNREVARHLSAASRRRSSCHCQRRKPRPRRKRKNSIHETVSRKLHQPSRYRPMTLIRDLYDTVSL